MDGGRYKLHSGSCSIEGLSNHSQSQLPDKRRATYPETAGKTPNLILKTLKRNPCEMKSHRFR
eukprot:6055966-Amphidinium_carterae.1